MRFPVKQFIVLALAGAAQVLHAYQAPVPPFAPAAGEEGTTAIAYTDAAILSWASGVAELTFGEEVSDEGNWKDPQAVLGPSSGGASQVLVLGRGGTITLEFHSRIADRDGFDFAVFENAFSDTFLELAYVEVSSDGLHFVRFPNYSFTMEPVGSWGHVQASLIHGYAGKYRAGYGTPFDLDILQEAYDAVLAGYDKFSVEFESQLRTNFPHLDLHAIKYVRLTDIPGDGTSRDSEGFPVYDPYPTVITAGFDLDAIGVMHPGTPQQLVYADWVSQFGLSGAAADDFDKDGWPDGVEYHFRTNPADVRDKPQVRIVPSSSGTGLDLAYAVSAIVQGGIDLHYSRDGSSWDLLQAAPLIPADPGEMEWIDGEPFIDRSIRIPDDNGEGFFMWTAILPGDAN